MERAKGLYSLAPARLTLGVLLTRLLLGLTKASFANLLLGLNGTLLPQSGAALATGLPSATSPYLFQEVWFKSLGKGTIFDGELGA
jgi:hypothetical protein